MSLCVYFNVCYFYSFFKCVLRHKFKFILFSMYFYTGSCNTNKIHFLIFFLYGLMQSLVSSGVWNNIQKKNTDIQILLFLPCALSRVVLDVVVVGVSTIHTHLFSSTWGSFFSCYFLLKLGSFTFKVYYFLVFVSDTNEEREKWGELGSTKNLYQICWFFFLIQGNNLIT